MPDILCKNCNGKGWEHARLISGNIDRNPYWVWKVEDGPVPQICIPCHVCNGQGTVGEEVKNG